ncbi:MAG: hypothetical protein KKF33_14440, partial [Alphaproteobacteria bacterium]|nr:hypothetical protein [Alphaproteobacteria bacterium]
SPLSRFREINGTAIEAHQGGCLGCRRSNSAAESSFASTETRAQKICLSILLLAFTISIYQFVFSLGVVVEEACVRVDVVGAAEVLLVVNSFHSGDSTLA